MGRALVVAMVMLGCGGDDAPARGECFIATDFGCLDCADTAINDVEPVIVDGPDGPECFFDIGDDDQDESYLCFATYPPCDAVAN